MKLIALEIVFMKKKKEKKKYKGKQCHDCVVSRLKCVLITLVYINIELILHITVKH